MTASGFSHVGLATHDMERTIAFYALLGFHRAADIKNVVADGGTVRMTYLRCGEEQFLVFMECKGVSDISETFDTGINSALGVPKGLYHISFAVSSLAVLDEKRLELISHGLDVSEKVDHGYAKSIYLRDPNDLQLEFCCFTRKFDPEDLQRQQDVKVASASRPRSQQ